jgi:hypothetical protein
MAEPYETTPAHHPPHPPHPTNAMASTPTLPQCRKRTMLLCLVYCATAHATTCTPTGLDPGAKMGVRNLTGSHPHATHRTHRAQPMQRHPHQHSHNSENEPCCCVWRAVRPHTPATCPPTCLIPGTQNGGVLRDHTRTPPTEPTEPNQCNDTHANTNTIPKTYRAAVFGVLCGHTRL